MPSSSQNNDPAAHPFTWTHCTTQGSHNTHGNNPSISAIQAASIIKHEVEFSADERGLSEGEQQSPTYRHSVGHQSIWVHYGDKLVQEVWLRLKQLWSKLLHHVLQLFCCIPRGSIPRLWFSPARSFKQATINKPVGHPA